MNIKKLLLFVATFLFAVNITACSEEEEPDPVVENKQKAIVEDWVNFQIPSVLRDSSLDVNMTIKEMLHDIEVVWSHPANVDGDEHLLTDFGYGNKEALYRIDATFGNLLPGKNVYEIVGYTEPKPTEEDEEKAHEEGKKLPEPLLASFTVVFDLNELKEVDPDLIDLSSVPTETDSESLEMIGKLTGNVENVRVFSWNERTEKATFTELSKFKAGESSFTYNAEQTFGNLLSGMNLYVVEALDDSGKIMSRKHFKVNSNKMTLMDQVEEMFGSLEKNDQGWYVSSTKPWFSLRPVFEAVSYEKEDRYSILPRPTLMYSADSTRETTFCDYLGAIDYAEEGMSYRAYSYETCQNYRYGVAAYDRFLSLLNYLPVEKILDVDYADIRERASSAFVMIETGGMSERETAVEFDTESFGEPIEEVQSDTEEESEETVHEGPYYYVYQMLITDGVTYEDKKIGDIAEEASEDRAAALQELKDFLTAHNGEELFTEMLFTGKDALDSDTPVEN